MHVPGQSRHERFAQPDTAVANIIKQMAILISFISPRFSQLYFYRYSMVVSVLFFSEQYNDCALLPFSSKYVIIILSFSDLTVLLDLENKADINIVCR
jgi:hypothetical protein